MPAIHACRMGQPSTNCANIQTPTNGSRNERTPMLRLARMFARSEAGSISAPARNVSTPLPSIARKLTHSVVFRMWWSPPKWMFPTITPTRISISATEIPSRMEIKLATSAKPIQIAAMNQMFSTISAGLRGRLFAPVIDRLDLLHRQQSAAHHFVEHRQEPLNLFFAIDNFDDQRQVHREPENFRGVQPTRLAEAHWPAQHGRASQVHFARFEHDGFVARLVMPAVALADESAQQDRVVGNLHKNPADVFVSVGVIGLGIGSGGFLAPQREG